MRGSRGIAFFTAAVATWLSAPMVGAQAQTATVAVDPTQDEHVISPLVYGMNFASDAQIAQGKIPLTRWGGNATTRYNYQIDTHNAGSDWYFENISDCVNNSCPPSNAQDNSTANAFIAQGQAAHITMLFTVPTIGVVPKGPPKYAHPYDCGCPKTAVPNQDGFDPYDGNCGNGKSGGKWVACPDTLTTTSIAISPQWVQDWIAYLVGNFGPSNGQIIYELDNEPALWSSTHHDAHPAPLGYDELWQRMRDYALAILQADPTALVAGFEEWGWPNYLCSAVDTAAGNCGASAPDRAKHGGEELTAWILDQAAAYEKQNGARILHYLDLHYYPQGGNSPDNIRSLWDKTYTDPSWINDKIYIIPRMHAWVDQHYPGTKLGISEYDWGNHNASAGAIAYAEVLGTFGREGLDYATAWGPPKETETAFGAYKLFRNYDGAGGAFQSVSVRAIVTGNGLKAYASVGTTQMTVVLVNETTSGLTTTVTLGNFASGAVGHYYELGNGVTISKKPDVPVTASGASFTMSASTVGLLVVDGMNPNALPDGGSSFGNDSGVARTGTDSGTDNGGAIGDGGRLADGGSAGAGDGGAGAADTVGVKAGRSGGCACRVAMRSGAPVGLLAGLPGSLALLIAIRRGARPRSQRQ